MPKEIHNAIIVGLIKLVTLRLRGAPPAESVTTVEIGRAKYGWKHWHGGIGKSQTLPASSVPSVASAPR